VFPVRPHGVAALVAAALLSLTAGVGPAASQPSSRASYLPIAARHQALDTIATPGTSPATPVPTPLATPAPAPAPPAVIALGPGFSDVVPHQIVRTADDRVYAFAGEAQYTAGLKAYWTTAPGLPTTDAAFDGSSSLAADGQVVTVDAAYDGGAIVHVLAYLSSGALQDYPFDTATNTFRPPKTLAVDGPSIAGDYIGSSAVSGMVDPAGRLHVAHWSAGRHLTYRSFSYDPAADALAELPGATQLDPAGLASHPALAISPADGAPTVAWVSEASTPPAILARTRGPAGWGEVEAVSTAPVWTSTSGGISVDQGPSLLIGTDGVRHLAYIEGYDRTGDYGRVHYVRRAGGGWSDTVVPATYTHNPALALDAAGQITLLGHGHPNNAVCRSERVLCVKRRSADGGWSVSETVASPSGSDSFDASVSVKWSAVGFNRPDVVEFVFFAARGGSYQDTRLHYGRL
jgi:hypothetical protein